MCQNKGHKRPADSRVYRNGKRHCKIERVLLLLSLSLFLFLVRVLSVTLVSSFYFTKIFLSLFAFGFLFFHTRPHHFLFPPLCFCYLERLFSLISIIINFMNDVPIFCAPVVPTIYIYIYVFAVPVYSGII